MVRIAFVTSADLSGTTGDSIATKEIVAALASLSGIKVVLLSATPSGDLPKQIESNIERVVSLPVKPQDTSTLRTLIWHGQLQLALARYLVPMLFRRVPDLVITRVSPSMVVPPVATTITRMPYTILVRGMVPRNLSFKRVAAVVVCLNSMLADEAYVAFQEVKEMVDRCRPSWRPPSHILPNAVDPDDFVPHDKDEAKADLDIDADEFVVGFVGTLHERHRTETLLRGATQATSDVSVLIVGDGPERERLETLAERLETGGDIRFVGRVEHSSVDRYIAACDVCYGVVDPDRPSNPIKVYEYLACERPVITSFAPEMLFVKENGFGEVLNNISPSTVGKAIDTIYRTNSKETKNIDIKSRSFVINNHSWNEFAKVIVGNRR